MSRYPVSGDGRAKPPDYARVARSLPDADLEDEILAGLGEPEYRAALVAELDRRAAEGAAVPS